MIYLAACAVDGKKPDAARVAEMDLQALYQAADRHLLTGVTAMALESAGVRDEAFNQAKGKAIRKVAALEVERAAVLAGLEEAGIWYLPLKGTVLKDLYPALGMRQMADIDILYDAARTKEVRSIMEGLGFLAEPFGRGRHDHYYKQPVCNFELHRALFSLAHDEKLYAYYRDPRPRMVKDEDNAFGYHFSPEDFYIYMIAHEYRHYSGGGTGLRSLLDTYVYWTRLGETLDRSCLDRELDKLGLRDFEEQNRSLALHLFGGEALTGQEQEMLDYVTFSGTYGTMQNRVKNRMAAYGGGENGKLRYMWDRFFVPVRQTNKNYRAYAAAYPLFYRHKLLLPLLPFYRLGRKWAGAKAELRALRREGQRTE